MLKHTVRGVLGVAGISQRFIAEDADRDVKAKPRQSTESTSYSVSAAELRAMDDDAYLAFFERATGFRGGTSDPDGSHRRCAGRCRLRRSRKEGGRR